jgi:hypothetical protein
MNKINNRRVALKSLKSVEKLSELLDEMNAMLALRHPSIVEVLGMALVNGQMMMVLELCEKGGVSS